jgi:hypothetical protein
MVLATCSGGSCPTIYAGDDGDLLVQGYRTPETHRQVMIPDGEDVVRIPRAVLLEAAARLNDAP